MLYAKQVQPRNQISPYCTDLYPDIAFKGNRHYINRIPGEWDHAERFIRMADTYDYLSLSVEDLKWNIQEDIPKPDSYTDEEVETIRSLLVDYQEADNEAKRLSALIGILNIYTGQTWIERTIRGSVQGEWQTIFYPEQEYSEKAIQNLEIEYFNLGTEWIIHDEKSVPEKPEDVCGYSVYLHGWDIEMTKTELAEALGCKPEEIVMWEYDHDMIVPIYNKIAAA